MFFGIRPEHRKAGVDAVLFHETFKYGAPRGYVEAEASMLLEDNVMIIRPTEAMGGHEYNRWRIYEMPVGPA